MKSLSPPCSPVLVLRHAGEEEWTRITASFDQICQEQICAFTRARWPASRAEPCLFFRDGCVVGGALMLLRDLPLGLGTIALCKLGPMLKDASAPDAFATYDAMVQLLVDEYATKRQMTLSILPQGFGTQRSQDFGSLLTRGFKADAPLRWPHRYTVALDKSEAEHRKCLAGKWRYHLKKSEAAGLTFEHAGAEALPEFAALYETMSARKKSRTIRPMAPCRRCSPRRSRTCGRRFSSCVATTRWWPAR